MENPFQALLTTSTLESSLMLCPPEAKTAQISNPVN